MHRGKSSAKAIVLAAIMCLATAATATATPEFGISQSYRDAGLNFPTNPTYNPSEDVFNSSDWKPLQIHMARAVVAYDIAQRLSSDERRIEFENWLRRVEALELEPFVVLGPSEKHLTTDKEAYVAPFSGSYTPAVEKFLATFGPTTSWDVHVIGAWNEPNFDDVSVPGGPTDTEHKHTVHLPQSESPGYSSKLLSDRPSGSCTNTTSCGPMMAAYYWLDATNAMKALCNSENKDPHGHKCAVVAGEFDSDGGTSAKEYWNPYASSFSQEAFGGKKPQWISFHGWADANPGTTCLAPKESDCLSYQFHHWLLEQGGEWAKATLWDTEAGAKIVSGESGETNQNANLNKLLTVSSSNAVSRLYYYNFQSRAELDAGLVEKAWENSQIEQPTRTVWVTIKNLCGCTAPAGADTYGGYPTISGEVLLIGVANPAGSALSSCRFEYGTTTAYGTTASIPGCTGTGNYPITYSTYITGLAASTTYHYRFTATNSTGTTNGGDRTFTTP